MLIVPMLRMGTIGMLETMIVPTLLRGNAAQDAPRPLSNVTQSHEHDQLSALNLHPQEHGNALGYLFCRSGLDP